MKDRRISKLIKNSILNLLYHAVLFGTINSLIWRTAVKRSARGSQNTSSPDGPVGTGSSVAHERVRVSALCRL